MADLTTWQRDAFVILGVLLLGIIVVSLWLMLEAGTDQTVAPPGTRALRRRVSPRASLVVAYVLAGVCFGLLGWAVIGWLRGAPTRLPRGLTSMALCLTAIWVVLFKPEAADDEQGEG